jgi:60 kDa SS-A/Ro ribonucleoprotein
MLPRVARTGTHLFIFAKYLEQFRGWGPVARRAVASWYLDRDIDALAYQLVKYRQREGWTHRDLLRSAHPKPDSDERNLLFKWATGRISDAPDLPKWVNAYVAAQFIERHDGRDRAAKYVQLIREYPGLPWEALPDEALAHAEVWRALLDAGMPQTALLRNLPKLTQLGVLAPMSSHLSAVCDQLSDPERLRKARVHPVSVLLAAKTYASGRSLRGSGTWSPVSQVCDALSDAFYAAFGAVEPAGKRTLIGLDISGSMGSPAGGLPITCREVTAAMSLVTAATEPAYAIVGFSHHLMPLSISPRQRLDDAVRAVSGLPFGYTDCALPMEWARQNRVEVDTFEVMTDNETWYGDIHPHQALENYRQATGIPARQVVVSITPTEFSIADPDDPGTMDVSGFDSDVPNLIAGFSRGDI